MSTSTLADALFERLHSAFPPEQAYTPTDWTDDAMPAPLRQYLTHLLRHHRRQEERYLRRARTDWVAYDHPDMEQATRTYLDRMEDHVQVPPDRWTETLRTASRHVTNYLVRPVPTLASFLFEDAAAAVPIDDIRWRMRFFGPYAYLRNAAEAFADKRDRDAFERKEFKRILRRVDERMTADFDADRWLRLLDPLFETVQHANGRGQIPLPLLRTFFEEKTASQILDQLAAHDRANHEVAVSRDTLRDLIASTTESESSTHRAEPPAEPSPSSPSQVASENDPSSEPDPAASDDAPGAPTPMWKQFEQNRPPSSNASAEESTDESQPLWTQFRSRKTSSGPDYDAPSSSPLESSAASESAPSDPDQAPPLAALERAVFGDTHTPNRTVYVRDLFQGDGEAYRAILERLRRTDTWSEASQIIARDVFRTHQVNIYSDAAVHFTDAVEAGFKDE